MERANALIVQQVEGNARSKAANRTRRQVRSLLSGGLLGLSGRVFVVDSEELPGLRGIRSPRVRSSDPAFINAAGGMIRAAREHLDALAKYGVTAGLIDDAGKLLAEYEAISTEAKAAFQARVEASRALDVVRAEIMGLIGRIDRLNRHRFASEPEALARWETARNLIGPAVKSTSGGVGGRHGHRDAPRGLGRAGGVLGQAADMGRRPKWGHGALRLFSGWRRLVERVSVDDVVGYWAWPPEGGGVLLLLGGRDGGS